MSESLAEQTNGESGSVGAGSTVPHSSDTPDEAAAAAALAMSVLESPAIAPDHEAPKADQPKKDAPKLEAPKLEARKDELVKADPRRGNGKVLIMAPSDRAWHDHSADVRVEAAEMKVEPEARPAAAPKRRFAGTAAMVALAVIAGALGGALATTSFSHVSDAAATTTPGNTALESSIARIDSDIVALKAGLEHTSRMGVSQFNKTNDRLDKIEKAQAEPAARLAKLTEAVDKLRPAPAPSAAPAAAPAAPKEVTGSVAPQPAIASAAPAASSAPATSAKSEVGRLPTVDGWVLADVGYGGAVVESRRGTYEVYAGDFIPGVGRVDAIRKQDGRWVVVTSKGLIVPR